MTGEVLPLRRRPVDRIFANVFGAFFYVSMSLDMFLALGIPLRPDSANAIARFFYRAYVAPVDQLLLDPPAFIRVLAVMNAFVFGPFYVVLFYALKMGRTWIRIPVFIYAGAMVYNMIIVFGVHFMGPNHDTESLFIICNLLYLIAPIALAWRMRDPDPFAAVRLK